MALVETLQVELPSRLSASDERDALARADAEGELQEWLEALGVMDAWEIAPPIIAAGWGAGNLSALMSGFSPGQQAALARWLAAAAVA
jgi:hypothetical protein